MPTLYKYFTLFSDSDGEIKATSHDGEEVDMTISFEALLFFITGAPREPPLMFDPMPTVCFHHSTDETKCSPYPRSNTCSNTIYLSTMDVPFSKFLYYMTSGVRSTAGFGLI